jgi:nicotinamidase-related amidase
MGKTPTMPEPGRTALIVVDMLTAYDYEDADAVGENAGGAVERIRMLLDQARGEDVEIVYVNDNYGDWRTSREQLVRDALHGRRPDLVEPIVPPDDADFVMKARHDIFYMTPVDYLLRERDCNRIVLTGQVTEQCVLYSALAAYVRHFQVVVPRDAVVHIDAGLAEAALRMMERNMHADVCDAESCALTASAPARS